MIRAAIAFCLILASFGPAYAQSSGNDSIDARHEAIMTLIMNGNDALSEGDDQAGRDPKGACLAYRRAVTMFSQAVTQTQGLRARLNANNPDQAALIEHMQVMQAETKASLTTAQTGVKANCH